MSRSVVVPPTVARGCSVGHRCGLLPLFPPGAPTRPPGYVARPEPRASGLPPLFRCFSCRLVGSHPRLRLRASVLLVHPGDRPAGISPCNSGDPLGFFILASWSETFSPPQVQVLRPRARECRGPLGPPPSCGCILAGSVVHPCFLRVGEVPALQSRGTPNFVGCTETIIHLTKRC